MLATCLLLSGAPGFGSLFRSPQPISLSLLFPDPALSPLGAVPCWLRCLSLVPLLLVLCLVIFLVGCLFVSLRFLWGYRPVFALSRLRGGVQLFVFPWHPPSPFLRFCLGHWVVFLALSSACRLVMVRRVFTVPCGLVWCFSYLPCGPYARPLFGPLAVPPFLTSGLVGMYSSRL